MSDKGSVSSKGGLGTNFEQHVQAAFLVSLLTGGVIPCILGARVTQLAFQTTKLGYETDDLLVTATSVTGQSHRLLLQIKNNLSISSQDAMFEQVLQAFWHDYLSPSLFDPALDRLVIVKSGLNDTERNHVKVILNWARAHAQSPSFFLEVRRIQEKTKRLEIFRAVLAKVSQAPVADDDLWRFLRCVELLDYDFMTTGSVDEASVLHLLSLAKSAQADVSALDLWHHALHEAVLLNSNGGSFAAADLAHTILYQRFASSRLDSVRQAVLRLARNSQAITTPLKNTVGGVKLDREAGKVAIQEALAGYDLVLVTGGAGVGKSALVRDVLAEQFADDGCFAFRADQFNEPHLSHVFTKQGIAETLEDMLGCLALLHEKVLFIDSAEKLLEGPPGNAFQQLLAMVQARGGLKIILTARQYAVDLLMHRYELTGVQRVVIPQLDDEEISQIQTAKPTLGGLLRNEKLQPLLRSLKYVDLAITLLGKTQADFSGVSLLEFKQQLWRYVVEDANTQGMGMPFKRNKAFLAVAVLRAQQMALFVAPDSVDEQALEALTHDGLLFRQGEEWRFAPTHDVLEDLALVKFINRHWLDSQGAESFFGAIGNEPALRRGFRLWVEDLLTADPDPALQLLEQTFSSSSVEKYWLDELLVAVFRSSRADIFFTRFETKLLENSAALLSRCMHLLRTACKQHAADELSHTGLLYPTGSGWAAAIRFAAQHRAHLVDLRLLITHVVLDWSWTLGSAWEPLPAEAAEVKTIVFSFFDQLEHGDEMWLSAPNKALVERLVKLALKLPEIAAPELTGLLTRAMAYKVREQDWRLRDFYEQLRNACLHGLYAAHMCRYLPEVVIELMNYTWKKRPKQEEDQWPGYRGSLLHNQEEAFGLETQHNDYPPSTYKTPVLQLLRYQPLAGMDFVVDLLNYCTDAYRLDQTKESSSLVEVTFTAANGTQVQQYGNSAFWGAYRGGSALPHVLESVLMSLEEYLLTMAGWESDISQKNSQWCFTHLLTSSRFAAITGVLTSVALAYPDALGEAWLPLLTVKEFIEWDYHRATHERLAGMHTAEDFDLPFAQQEREASNQLPHRTQYESGLVSFVADYQHKNGPLTPRIQQILDEYHQAVTPETDFLWRKHLREMDMRHWAVTAYDPAQRMARLQPVYDDTVKSEMASAAPYFAAQSRRLAMSAWIGNILEKQDTASCNLVTWSEIYADYTRPGRKPFHENRLAGLAVIGLRYLAQELTPPQRVWCWKTINVALRFRIEHANDYEHKATFDERNHLFDHQFVLQSFVLLHQFAPNGKARHALVELLLRAVTTHFPDYLLTYLYDHLRNEFFVQHPDMLAQVWRALLEVSRLEREEERLAESRKDAAYQQGDMEAYYRPYNPGEHQAARLTWLRAMAKQAAFADVSVEQISLRDYEPTLLMHALRIIPFNTTAPNLRAFVQRIAEVVVVELQLSDDRYARHGTGRERQLQYQQQAVVEYCLPRFLVHNDNANGLLVLDTLLAGMDKVSAVRYGPGEDAYKFCRQVLTYTIVQLDQTLARSTDKEVDARLIQHFWLLWVHLLAQLTTPGRKRLASLVLLKIDWKESAKHWLPLETGRAHYQRAMRQLGGDQLEAVLHVLAAVGDKTLLPHALTTVVELLQAHPNQQAALVSDAALRLIKRLYHRHMQTIKAQRRLVTEFIWLLSLMIDLGVSAAYMIREDVITFKSY
jgi:hypothetical protein